MFAVTAAATAALSTAGWAQNPQAVMSWGAACPTVVSNMAFTTATTYPMYIAIKNLTANDVNVGTDINLFIGRGVPDCWRFDDAGCQTGSQVSINNNGTKLCPMLRGTNPLAITAFQYYGSESPTRENVRLAITYDNNVVPAPGTTYIAWNVIFDHTFSVTGAGAPPATCGGAAQPLCIAMTDPSMRDYASVQSVLLENTGTAAPLTFAAPTDGYLTWNGGLNCPGAVPTEPATWGKLKALYH
jgi:hypothetical protein